MFSVSDNVFLAFDLETTGLKPYTGDRIIEIAAIPIHNNKINYKYSYYSLVNPEVTVTASTAKYHKLSDKDISKAPFLKDVFPKFKNYISTSVLVSHNIEMDLKFLDMAAKESGIFPVRNYYIDTLELSRYFVDMRSYKLETLAKRFKIDTENFHRAWDDAVTTAKLFLKLLNIFKIKDVSDFIKKWG
jgi:DNA polymerase-3 subunit epsilon